MVMVSDLAMTGMMLTTLWSRFKTSRSRARSLERNQMITNRPAENVVVSYPWPFGDKKYRQQ